MNAFVSQTNIPGLVDVRLADGTTFSDITMGQLKTLVARHGWHVEFVQP
jgi:hypothetical protein